MIFNRDNLLEAWCSVSLEREAPPIVISTDMTDNRKGAWQSLFYALCAWNDSKTCTLLQSSEETKLLTLFLTLKPMLALWQRPGSNLPAMR